MFRLKNWSDLTCFSAFGSPLKTVAPENPNVLFPRLSFTLGIWRSSFLRVL